MKKFLLCILSALSFSVFAQTKPVINEPFVGLAWRETEVQEIDSLNQLPDRINYIIHNLFQYAMTDFVDSIVFMQGQITDLEQWAATDSSFQTDYQFVVPKYELSFELRDASIGIQSYCFKLGLDQYGQIILFEWPREAFGTRSAFVSPTELEKTARKYAKKKRYKTESCLYQLYLDEISGRICWRFNYLQKSTGDEFNFSREYNSIIVDAIDNVVLLELGMGMSGHSCP